MASRKLKLYFKDQVNNSKSVTVDYPKETYTSEDLKSAMDTMSESGILLTKNGSIVNKDKAEIETLDKKELAIG